MLVTGIFNILEAKRGETLALGFCKRGLFGIQQVDTQAEQKSVLSEWRNMKKAEEEARRNIQTETEECVYVCVTGHKTKQRQNRQNLLPYHKSRMIFNGW